MLISICIPHYNRARYLLVVLDSILRQDHPEIEVVISDDCSADESAQVVPAYIASRSAGTRVRFKYVRQAKNLGFDGNLRAALAGGAGEYLFILGNDDALARPETLTNLARTLVGLGFPDAIFTNFYAYGREDERASRAAQTRLLGSGPDAAARNYRSFSFVGGVVFKRTAFELHDTPAYDGSIYYQIYLAARIAAAGGTLASIAESMVAKDVVIDGKPANSFVDTLARDNAALQPKTGGLDQVARVACEAILPYAAAGDRDRYAFLIISQILALTYPYWLCSYRKLGVPRAAMNLALGCFPPRLIRVGGLSLFVRARLFALYVAVTASGLLLPVWVLEGAKERLRALSSRMLAAGRRGSRDLLAAQESPR
jgi:glycosyltransferase involved in cell wall biosynthesis